MGADMAFYCTSAWEGGFVVGVAAGLAAALSLSLALAWYRGRR